MLIGWQNDAALVFVTLLVKDYSFFNYSAGRFLLFTNFDNLVIYILV